MILWGPHGRQLVRRCGFAASPGDEYREADAVPESKGDTSEVVAVGEWLDLDDDDLDAAAEDDDDEVWEGR